MRVGAPVVALGGGHGLAASLSALRRLTDQLTAVVSVGDDGGSSGRLRRELGIVPPGDLRMALVALSGDDAERRDLAELCQHRFAGNGELAGHAVGNLVLAGLLERCGEPVAALELAGRLFGLRPGTRVLPMCPVPVDLVGTVRGVGGSVREVRGQTALTTAHADVLAVRVEPAAVAATPAAVEAVTQAHAVVLGPGSLYTSLLPHLLIGQLRAALLATTARRVLVLNLAAQAGETDGFAPQHHLEALHRQVGDLSLHVVLADRGSVADPRALEAACARLGARLVLAEVADRSARAVHDPDRLAPVLAECLQLARAEPAAAAGRRGRWQR